MNLYVVVRHVILCKIISQFFCAWFPEDMEMVLFDSILNPIKAHINDF